MANDDPLRIAIDEILDQHEVDGALAAHLTALCVATGMYQRARACNDAIGEYLYREYITDFAVGIRALTTTMLRGAEMSWPPADWRAEHRGDESPER